MAISYHLHIYCTNSKTCEVSMKHNLKMSVINVSSTAHKDGYLDQGFWDYGSQPHLGRKM